MSVLKEGILISVDSPKSKKIKYHSELWSTKVLDLKGQGKYNNSKKCIHLARCSQVEPDNYSSEKFFIKHSDGFTDDLLAESESERTEWIKCICEVCGLINPLLKKPAPVPPKKSKPPPPLPPPKPISEEKKRHEENNMYEEISGDEGDNEYTTLSEAPPEPEGGVLRYDYADMDRGVRPMSVHHDEYGGSGGSTTGASGSGAFHSNDSGSDNDEYIEAVSVTPMIVPQKTNQKNQYLNTLDGRDLGCPKQPDMKCQTLPHRSASYKDKGRKQFSPPPGSKPNMNHSFGGNSNSDNEFFSKLNQRRKQVEGNNKDDDDVFVREPPKVTAKTYPRPGYQNTAEAAITDEKKAKKSSGLGQQRQNHFNRNNDAGPPQPPEKPNSRMTRADLPIQDPPWWKNETKTLPPSRDPPQVKKKSPHGYVDENRLNKPCPLPPSQPQQDWRRKSSSDQIASESTINKPLPMTPQQRSPRLQKKTAYAILDEDRLNMPCPLPPSHDTGWPKRRTSSDETDNDGRVNKLLPKTPPSLPQKTGKTWERKFTPHNEGSPPPPLPERGSSKKDLFDNTPSKVAHKSRPPVGNKSQPPQPPMKPKTQPVLQDYDSDDDFPTADQFKKSQGFTNSSSWGHSSRPPSVLPKSSYRDPVNDRPPLPPPKHSTGHRYR